jgi:hypothetical protein
VDVADHAIEHLGELLVGGGAAASTAIQQAAEVIAGLLQQIGMPAGLRQDEVDAALGVDLEELGDRVNGRLR